MFYKEIDEKEYKEICFDMLLSFSKVCEEYNLHYILDYGTLLGSIRHHGFIPWDDDIDVSMKRVDYERLYNISTDNPSVFGKYYRLASWRNEFNVHKPILNLIDIRTITISPSRNPKYYFPIWIDIFPFDNSCKMPKDNKKVLEKCIKMKEKTWKLLCLPETDSKSKKLLYLLYEKTNNIDLILGKLDYLASNTGIEEDLLRCYLSPYGIKDISYSDMFTNTITGEFQGYCFPIPKDYDIRLKQLYGDYMQIPPENERIIHTVKSFWK